MVTKTINVPDLGGAQAVEVIEIPVNVGDQIEEESTIIVLESDKATMDVPSPMGGQIKKILVKLGDSIGEGSPIVELEITEENQSSSSSSETEVEPEGESVAIPKDDPETKKNTGICESIEKPIELPDLGTDDSVEVIDISVVEGDTVAEGDTLFTLEGDKATMEVPSPFGGVIVKISVRVGDKVKSGDRVGVATVTVGSESASTESNFDTEDSSAKEVNKDKSRETITTLPKDAAPPGLATGEALNEPEAPAETVYAGPLVRQMARGLGVDLRNVEGSGAKGRIQAEDVQAYVKKALDLLSSSEAEKTAQGGGVPSVADVDYAKFGDVEDVALSKIARLTAANMTRSWLNVPAVTQFDDADITELDEFRKSMKAEAEKRGVKLTPLAFIMLACGRLVKEHEAINRSWHSSGEKAIQKRFAHIGLAVDTPKGLLVPVIRNVDEKGLFEVASDIGEYADKARSGKLSAADMQGASMTISSLGAIGGKGFTPIVNTPETAILGVSKVSVQPVWNGTEFVPRQLLPLSLTYDHRLVNGADGGRFLTELVDVLGDIRRLLL